jgi:hypothetical protein
MRIKEGKIEKAKNMWQRHELYTDFVCAAILGEQHGFGGAGWICLQINQEFWCFWFDL